MLDEANRDTTPVSNATGISARQLTMVYFSMDYIHHFKNIFSLFRHDQILRGLVAYNSFAS